MSGCSGYPRVSLAPSKPLSYVCGLAGLHITIEACLHPQIAEKKTPMYYYSEHLGGCSQRGKEKDNVLTRHENFEYIFFTRNWERGSELRLGTMSR